LILSQPLRLIVNGIGTFEKFRNRYKDEVKGCPALTGWIVFCFLLIIQLLLGVGIRADLDPAKTYSASDMMIQIILALNVAMMVRLLVPDLNAPDVWDKINSKQEYLLQDYYRLHLKSLVLHGAIHLPLLFINYGIIHGGYQNFVADRLLYYITYALILAAMVIFKPRGKGKEDKPYTWLHRFLSWFAATVMLWVIFNG
jgi:hypothetical protein